MASESELPTVDTMFGWALAELRTAYKALGDASDCLRSDTRPLGAALTPAQRTAKSTTYDRIQKAKQAINDATHAISEAGR
jgi:hypothetical protein